MIEYLKKLLWDEGSFLAMLRGVFVAVGIGMETGQIKLPQGGLWDVLGWGLIVGGLMMRSSVPPPAALKRNGGGA